LGSVWFGLTWPVQGRVLGENACYEPSSTGSCENGDSCSGWTCPGGRLTHCPAGWRVARFLGSSGSGRHRWITGGARPKRALSAERARRLRRLTWGTVGAASNRSRGGAYRPRGPPPSTRRHPPPVTDAGVRTGRVGCRAVRWGFHYPPSRRVPRWPTLRGWGASGMLALRRWGRVTVRSRRLGRVARSPAFRCNRPE